MGHGLEQKQGFCVVVGRVGESCCWLQSSRSESASNGSAVWKLVSGQGTRERGQLGKPFADRVVALLYCGGFAKVM